ncbi:MAG: 2OG-Fe(II) oxygenase [Mycobacterium sp.]|nr:2OG-Fe(II) oxygenase [Mycobacterium sp.]
MPDDLTVDIAGVGLLELPVSAAQVRLLRSIARPARYGLGEQTLVDSRVRDTWELPKSRVRIDRRRWNKTLGPVLAELRAGLGLPDGCRLRAELHSVLMYEQGQFFAPHKDSEKSDAMVGTLVVTLPSTSRGGALVVQHGGRREEYRSSNRLLSFVAFYADCQHEVLPLTSGHRVALTYNLSLVGDSSTSEIDEVAVAEVSRCLRTHFEGQDRLVYLLDHEYTEHGLSFERLKGVDAARVAVLCAAARERGDEIVLALADVHETWSCDEPYQHHSWYDEYEDDDEPDPESYDLGELLDGATTLAASIDPSGAPTQVGAPGVSDDEVCATTPSGQLQPYASEYEGYMGNYGNTMDRWYRRGAVVMWPRSRDFAVRAQGSPRWALDVLGGLLREKDLAGARERTGLLARFWADVAARRLESDAGDGTELGAALGVAFELDDAPLATMLLGPFRLDQVSAREASALAAVAGRYGVRWFRQLLAEWDTARRGWGHDGQRRVWIAELPALCRALTERGAGNVARDLLEVSATGFLATLERAGASAQPSRRAHALGELAGPAAGLLVGAVIAEDTEVGAKLSAALSADDEQLRCAMTTLRLIAEVAPEQLTVGAIEDLVEITRMRLSARLARPARDPEDWSICAPDTCACELCGKLDAFLLDPASRHLDWPLAEQRRRHVHDRIDRFELPVRHETRRSGRPYTLVLTKTSALFERESTERDVDLVDLRWLETIPLARPEDDDDQGRGSTAKA